MSKFIEKLQTLKSIISNSESQNYNHEALRKYKASHDKYQPNQPLNEYFSKISAKIDKKIGIINNQLSSKQAYLHFVDNDISVSQFSHNDESTYNTTTLSNLLNLPDNLLINELQKHNFTEDLYLDESNIFFDVDYKELKESNENCGIEGNEIDGIDDVELLDDELNEGNKEDNFMFIPETGPETPEQINYVMFENLRKLLNSIVDIYNELLGFVNGRGTIYLVGTIEYKSKNQKVNTLINKMKNEKLFESVLFYTNESDECKDISGHLFFNCCADRDLLKKYIMYHANKSGYLNKHSPFDSSVYVGKGDRQALRCSFSPKIERNKSIRPISSILVSDVPKFRSNYLLCSMAPNSMSISITEQLNNYIINNNIQEIELTSNPKKEKKTNNLQRPKTNSNIPVLSQKSIFKYIAQDKNINSISDIVFNGATHFDIVQLLMPYLSMPLSIEEFTNEILNIELTETEKFPKEKHDEFLHKILSKVNYVQDYRNIQPLYLLKKYTYKHMENWKKECKQEQIELDEDIKAEYTEIIESIDFYITKYSKISFASHNSSFYNILTTRGGTKEQKILYNIYGLLNGTYVEPFTDTIYNNITELRKNYKMSGDTADYIEQNITYFKSISEYEHYVAEYEYSRLNQSQKQNLDKDVLDLIEILKGSFYDENDMKYYLGFLSSKLRKKSTNNKGIINQPRNNCGSGKDSLKTFITDLLDSYLDIVSPNVENINKPLNGGYFKSDLIIFQEMPKDIKDIENFINRIKENSCTKKLTTEEKGKNPTKIKNKVDYIINTNYTMEKLFYKKNDCEALLKRFKVIERKSINMADKHVKYVLDQFGHLYNTELNELLHSHAFYLYLLNNDEYYQYFIKNKEEEGKNDIEQLYIDSAIDTKTSNSMITTYLNQDEFIDNFQERFCDSKTKNQSLKRIKIKALLTELMVNIKEYKDVKKPDTIKHHLLTTRLLNYNPTTKKYEMTVEQIIQFYETYYSYEDKPEEDVNM